MLDSSFHYIVMRWYPNRLAESPRKMMNRQLRNFGEHFQSYVFLEMRIYVFAYSIGACWCQAPAIHGRIYREWQVCEHAESRSCVN
jgi:hypothetical protein